MDNNTQKNIADALWLESYDESKLSDDTAEACNSNKNSNHAIGERVRDYLDWLDRHPQSFNPSYHKRYSLLKETIKDLNTQQAYAACQKLLGNNAVQGYDQIPETADLKFPRDHEPKLRSQVGWHFFVGSAWDEDGQEYGIEIMFFRVAMLPPELAKKHGLTDIENQIVELQLGISRAGERHHQADPVVVAGTTGLISFKPEPFTYTFGKNKISAEHKSSFWPLNVTARGIDRGKSEPFPLAADLTFTSGKEYLLQGDNGAMPSIAGMGTLYYSIPNIVLKSGSTINYGGKTIKLKNGSFWFDHQWGFLGGNSTSPVLRAASNINKPAPAGWDWFMAQFEGNRQITMFASHGKKYMPFYFQTGAVPPGKMTVEVGGKYMDEHKKLYNTWGTLVVDRWIRSEGSPNPQIYPVTHTWHPNSWHFSFNETMPKDIREFHLEQIVPSSQTNFFANGSQYNEGAVYVKSPEGKDIGRGFAESVQYADPWPTVFHIMGFGNDAKLMAAIKNNGASLSRRLVSLAYMLTHQKQLKATLAKSKGMEFFGPTPKK
ncbi:ATP-binding protein [Candidatus Saccharibacteria bacterium]|nr:ATP-binding protein [Candidatus Saccharibacteria bacterium]